LGCSRGRGGFADESGDDMAPLKNLPERMSGF
jgi:hypothetical protein